MGNEGYVIYLFSKSLQRLTYKLYTSDQVYLLYLKLAASGAKSTSSARKCTWKCKTRFFLRLLFLVSYFRLWWHDMLRIDFTKRCMITTQWFKHFTTICQDIVASTITFSLLDPRRHSTKISTLITVITHHERIFFSPHAGLMYVSKNLIN